MAEDVIITAYDTTKTPNSVPKTLHNVRISKVTDRDIKVFDLGVFASLMDDVFGGLKLPNYITDWGRSRQTWTLEFQLVEGQDGDDQQTLEGEADDLDFFFDVTCYKYRYVKLEAGSGVTTDQKDASNNGTGPIYVRVKSFRYVSDMTDQGKIDCTLELWQGQVCRLID